MRSLRISGLVIFILLYGLLPAQESNPLKTWWGFSGEFVAFGPMVEMTKHMINHRYDSKLKSWFGDGYVEYPHKSDDAFSVTLVYGVDIKTNFKYELLLHYAYLGEIGGYSGDDYYQLHFVDVSFRSTSLTPTLIYVPKQGTELQFGPAIYLNRYGDEFGRRSDDQRIWSAGMMAGFNFAYETEKVIIKPSIRYYAAFKNKVGPFPSGLEGSTMVLPEGKIGFGHFTIGVSFSFYRYRRNP